MATLTESQAVFESKLKDMGLEGYKDAMTRRGWTTLSTFAFASSWSPGSGDDTSFVNQVVLGAADHADLPKLRKLYHEAYTVVAAELRSKLDRAQETDASKTRKLPPVERKTRWTQMKVTYGHLQMSDQLEPAHHVVDKCHSMKVEGELRYLGPHEVPTRDQELLNVKTEELIKRDASGHLRAHDETKLPEADTKTDLRLRQACTRRGLALEVADVMAFTTREKLIDKMFQEIAAADRRAFKLMAEELQGDLGRDATGKRLADSALEKVIMEPAFITLLLPLPGAKAGAGKDQGDQAPEATGSTASKRKLMRENQKLKEKLKETDAKKTKAAPHAEADKAGAPKKMPIKMPRELWGYSPMKHGERI